MALSSISLCAGAAGIDLGLRLADPSIRTVCYVEWSHFPAAVIAARIKDGCLDDAPVWDDVGTFDGKPWRGKVDVITAGFPCQPVSLAGQRKGMSDERFIWGDIERIISEVEPRYVFLENVPGIVSADDGWFLDRVLSGLVSLGFDCEWDLFSAEETGAPHRRQRWFCLAVSNTGRGGMGRIQHVTGASRIAPDTGKDGEPLANTESRRIESGQPWIPSVTDSSGRIMDHSDGARPQEQRQSFRIEPEQRNIVIAGNDNVGHPTGGTRLREAPRNSGHAALSNETVADTKHTEREWDGRYESPNHRVYPPARNDYEGWAGIEAGSQPAFRRDADGLAIGMDPSLFEYRNKRLQTVGNGVVPLTVALAWVELNRRFH